jgi:chromosome segregation ATPase
MSNVRLSLAHFPPPYDLHVLIVIPMLARTGLANPEFQFIVISLKAAFYENAAALVGIYRDGGSRTLTLDVRSTSTYFSSPFEDVND